MPWHVKYLKDIFTWKLSLGANQWCGQVWTSQEFYVVVADWWKFLGLALCVLGVKVIAFPYSRYQKTRSHLRCAYTKSLKLDDDMLKLVQGFMEIVKVVNFFYLIDFMLLYINDSLVGYVPLI